MKNADSYDAVAKLVVELLDDNEDAPSREELVAEKLRELCRSTWNEDRTVAFAANVVFVWQISLHGHGDFLLIGTERDADEICSRKWYGLKQPAGHKKRVRRADKNEGYDYMYRGVFSV